jgi:hypothetical protein
MANNSSNSYPIIHLFHKIKIRVSKVEELENILSLEHRLKTLKTDPKS